MATLHVTFGLSAAASLREAIAVERPDDCVVAFRDDLSFGPIDPPEPRRRAEWIADHLNFEWWDDIALSESDVWGTISTWRGDTIAWFSRTSASEHANFLEFNERMGSRPFRILDLTNARVSTNHPCGEFGEGEPVVSVSLLRGETIRRYGLADRSVVPSEAQRDLDRGQWKRLKSESAALRVVEGRDLVSAAITHFDERLLSFCTREWATMAGPIDGALRALAEHGTHQVGDLVLASRIFALIEAGVLQGRGGLTSLRDTEVRLRDAPSRSGD